jgi:HEPN domain-containing protein
MTETAPSLPPEAVQNLFDSLLSTFVQPEAVRRVQAGQPLPPNTPIFAIQVVFNVGRDPEVRLNEEVGGFMEARAARTMAKGEPVTSADISEITRVELTHADPDAAHITALCLADGWHISWDGRYNASVIAAHLQTADEFLELAEVAIEKGLLRAFAENAFEAAELLAKAEILALPDAQLLKSKKHGAVASRFNRWAQLGNTDLQYAQLRNQLERLRGSARYLRGDFGLDQAQAEEMLSTLQEMRRHADEVAPRRTIGSPG